MASANPDRTPNLHLPSPKPPDPPDIPGDIKALADAIDAAFLIPAPQADYHAAERVWAQGGGTDYANLTPTQSVTITNGGTGKLMVKTTLTAWAYQDGTDSAVFLKVERTGSATTVYQRTAKTSSDDTITAERVDIIDAGGAVTFTAQGHKYGNGRPSIKYASLAAVPIQVISGTVPSYPDTSVGGGNP